ncbi:hypothetical protein ACHAWO_006853 [Cyclotella atomus]|uniref:C3H1-type domain-containing protein n=1 Tax=Cyclotella atomus TaxID=382360 RepID=A0ABD3NQ28_9STRA
MRTDPSMNQQGDVGSPHMSRMEGDLSKINPIQHHQNTLMCAARDDQNMSAAHRSHFANIENTDGSHRPIQNRYSEGSTMIQSLPQFTWSNIVSSNSPIKFTKSSDETVMTSNNSAASPYGNAEYTNQRSRSFDGEERSQDIKYMPQSIGFGHHTTTPTRPQNSWGMPLPHPPSYRDGNPHHQLPTINQGVQGPSTPLHSPMMNYTNHSYECFSPLSLCDSTDQTTPLSSPSMSPHITPMQGHHEPPMWQLSSSPSNTMNVDSNEFHSQHAPQRMRPPEQIRNNNFYQFGPQVYNQNRVPQGYIHPRSYSSGPASPTKQHHVPNAGPHHHHAAQSRRPVPPSGPMNRSSTEVLKTLLRKKACLYEPDTSSAVALVTWLVGRRLAISHGFFSRQQLQWGVHSCVASKIKEGHVTRTKVNRCMQIILNSCFHYIIPRSDGSEESGDLFREMFQKNAANDEQMLQSLPPPWHNLSLEALNLDEGSFDPTEGGSDDDASHQSPRKQGKHSSTTSHAGESIDSGKRSVLLCFNENIRSAADVFRCHNEFIRDVAHASNLNLSIDDWKLFFAGSKAYRRVPNTEASAQRYFQFMGPTQNDGNVRMDSEGLAKFHTSWCAKRYDHDNSLCVFAHVEVNRGWLRRDPFIYKYKPVLCSCIIPLQAPRDCFMNVCPQGVDCSYAHSREEIIYHPESYKRNPCSNTTSTCHLKDICPNTHAKLNGYMDGASHGYSRHGKRHHITPKKTGQASHGQSTGFEKRPDGSPMLYIDPAPVSEYEEGLLLPGLKALFRDFSQSMYNSLHEDNAYEYGLFGYKPVPKKENREASPIPIGKV